jgi:hypothetical protein
MNLREQRVAIKVQFNADLSRTIIDVVGRRFYKKKKKA